MLVTLMGAAFMAYAGFTAPPRLDVQVDLSPPPLNAPKGPSEYQLNLGRAIDTLRVDHPRLFTHKPDFSIFTEDVVLRDPSGAPRLSGLDQYSRVFDMLRFLRRGTMQDAQLTHSLVVSDSTIRVRWNAKLWMRDPALGFNTLANGEAALVHLDGVSVYELNDAGLVRAHGLENIVISGGEKEQAAVARLNLPFAWPGASEQLVGIPTYTPSDSAPLFLPMPERASPANQRHSAKPACTHPCCHILGWRGRGAGSQGDADGAGSAG